MRAGDRKMQVHWANETAYYRCRFPAEYALANDIHHPRNMFVRENEVLPALDAWLTKRLRPHRIDEAIEALAAAEDVTGHHQALAQATETE